MKKKKKKLLADNFSRVSFTHILIHLHIWLSIVEGKLIFIRVEFWLIECCRHVDLFIFEDWARYDRTAKTNSVVRLITIKRKFESRVCGNFVRNIFISLHIETKSFVTIFTFVFIFEVK